MTVYVMLHLARWGGKPDCLPEPESVYPDTIAGRLVTTYVFDAYPWAIEDPLDAAGISYLSSQDGQPASVSCRCGEEFASCHAIEGRPAAVVRADGVCDKFSAENYYRVRALFLATLPEA